MQKEKWAFVIMPFTKTASYDDWTEVFDNVFKPALEDCGYRCERAAPSSGSLIASIVQSLLDADLVIADVTDRNANVFYELGVRHSLKRGTIIVSQGIEHVPSDLQGYWWIKYGLSPGRVTDFKKEIKRLVREFESKPEHSDSPVLDYLNRTTGSPVQGDLRKEDGEKIAVLVKEKDALGAKNVELESKVRELEQKLQPPTPESERQRNTAASTDTPSPKKIAYASLWPSDQLE